MEWAEQFFQDGWTDQPWVVIDRKPAVCREEEFRAVLGRAKQTENWVFGLWEDSVLHAPTFGVVASGEIQLRIISALEAYPARRVVEFEQFERPNYEKAGWPHDVIEHMTPRPEAQLTAEHFNSPILTTAHEAREFVGTVATWDMVFGALTRCEVPIDRAAALRILLTVHGDPGEEFEKTPFSAPLHPAEFGGLVGRLWGRSPNDPSGELLRILADQIPRVVSSLRKRPPTERRAHPVGRRRLATAASNVLWPTRRRRVSENPREDPDDKLRSALGMLTSEQRQTLDTQLARAPLQKALVDEVEQGNWSVRWWKGRSGVHRTTSTLRRMRQEILRKVRAAAGDA